MSLIEVDQSGRIEFTSEDTILAFSNGKQFSILVTSNTKRFCIKHLREIGFTGNTFYLKFFSICLFHLLKDHITISTRILIDQEYIGNESLIKSDLLNILRRSNYKIFSDQICFGYIGKKSPAHYLAIETLRKNRTPHKEILPEDILKEFRPQKKIGVLL